MINAHNTYRFDLSLDPLRTRNSALVALVSSIKPLPMLELYLTLASKCIYTNIIRHKNQKWKKNILALP